MACPDSFLGRVTDRDAKVDQMTAAWTEKVQDKELEKCRMYTHRVYSDEQRQDPEEDDQLQIMSPRHIEGDPDPTLLALVNSFDAVAGAVGKPTPLSITT